MQPIFLCIFIAEYKVQLKRDFSQIVVKKSQMKQPSIPPLKIPLSATSGKKDSTPSKKDSAKKKKLQEDEKDKVVSLAVNADSSKSNKEVLQPQRKAKDEVKRKGRPPSASTSTAGNNCVTLLYCVFVLR